MRRPPHPEHDADQKPAPGNALKGSMCHRDVKSGLVGDLLELSYYGKEDPAAVIVELDLDLHALSLAHEADHGAHAELLVPDAVPRAERRDLFEVLKEEVALGVERYPGLRPVRRNEPAPHRS